MNGEVAGRSPETVFCVLDRRSVMDKAKIGGGEGRREAEGVEPVGHLFLHYRRGAGDQRDWRKMLTEMVQY